MFCVPGAFYGLSVLQLSRIGKHMYVCDLLVFLLSSLLLYSNPPILYAINYDLDANQCFSF